MNTKTQDETPPTEAPVEIEIIEDVNDAAENGIGLGCGNDNPYR